jgi:formiminotetrahydrofolate cyclodeaminase
MVAALTLSREKYASAHEAMRPIAQAAASARAKLLELSREDSEAFDEVVAARRLPKATEEEKAARDAKIAAANLRAAQVPLETARTAGRLLESIPDLAELGNPNAASDAGSSALLLEAAVQGALLNVSINLSGLADSALSEEIRQEAETLQVDASRLRERALGLARSRM